MKCLTAGLLVVASLLAVNANGNGGNNYDADSQSASTATSDSDATATGGAGGNAQADGGSVGDVSQTTEIINPDKIKLRNTPGVYSGAAEGNAGFGIAVPGFGLSLNAPVNKEDARLQGLAQQLWEMGSYGPSRRVLCQTHRLKKAFEGTDLDCFDSLGGDTTPVGKLMESEYDEFVSNDMLLLADNQYHEDKLAELEKQLEEEASRSEALEQEIQKIRKAQYEQARDDSFTRFQQKAREALKPYEEGYDGQ